MTRMTDQAFLKNLGIDPSDTNVARWRDGWTLSELQSGVEYRRIEYEATRKMEQAENNLQNWGKKYYWDIT